MYICMETVAGLHIPSQDHSCSNVAWTRKQQLSNDIDDGVVHDMQVAMTQENG